MVRTFRNAIVLTQEHLLIRCLHHSHKMVTEDTGLSTYSGGLWSRIEALHSTRRLASTECFHPFRLLWSTTWKTYEAQPEIFRTASGTVVPGVPSYLWFSRSVNKGWGWGWRIKQTSRDTFQLRVHLCRPSGVNLHRNLEHPCNRPASKTPTVCWYYRCTPSRPLSASHWVPCGSYVVHIHN